MIVSYKEQGTTSEGFNRRVEWHGTWVQIERYNAQRTYWKKDMSAASWTRLHKLVVSRHPSISAHSMTAYFAWSTWHAPSPIILASSMIIKTVFQDSTRIKWVDRQLAVIELAILFVSHDGSWPDDYNDVIRHTIGKHAKLSHESGVARSTRGQLMTIRRLVNDAEAYARDNVYEIREGLGIDQPEDKIEQVIDAAFETRHNEAVGKIEQQIQLQANYLLMELQTSHEWQDAQYQANYDIDEQLFDYIDHVPFVADATCRLLRKRFQGEDTRPIEQRGLPLDIQLWEAVLNGYRVRTPDTFDSVRIEILWIATWKGYSNEFRAYALDFHNALSKMRYKSQEQSDFLHFVQEQRQTVFDDFHATQAYIHFG